MENLRPNEQRAKNAILLIWIVLALEIVNLTSSYMQYDLLQTVANGGFTSDEAAEANDTREGLLGMIYLIAYLISAVTFIMWFRRAYFNLHQKVNTLQFSEGWAAGSWFVPIVNLYRPYQIMKEIYVETKRLFTRKGLSEKIDYSTSYLGWWWTLWIISAIIGQFVFRFSLKSADTIDNLIITTAAQMILSILGIPLALITIKIIKDYSKVEPLLTEISDEEPKVDSENDAENVL
ncbi:MAG: DUF4328 domain-containing protein [Dysgonamonadaceae bacterium]|jgi:hypothetical protein|nr:DUF4328 domain-containing protein [Dysgonamonadaceae bacterium]